MQHQDLFVSTDVQGLFYMSDGAEAMMVENRYETMRANSP